LDYEGLETVEVCEWLDAIHEPRSSYFVNLLEQTGAANTDAVHRTRHFSAAFSFSPCVLLHKHTHTLC
jgi:hypothetical protein